MNNLSQECIEQIEKANPFFIVATENAFNRGAKAALTNPTIYQSAGLMTVEEALRFAEWVQYECIRHEGDWILDKRLYTTTELLTIFRNQNKG